MKYTISLLVTLFMLVSCGANTEEKITESDVLEMINSMKEAVKFQNADQLMSHFSPDARMTFDMPENMGGKIEAGVQEYQSMAKQSWALPAKYTYEVKDVYIEVDLDGLSATVRDTTIETMEMNGQIILSTQSEEHIDIISKDGKPLIVKLYGKVVN